MQPNLGDFLRHGDNGQYVIARRHGQVVGRSVGLSL